MILNEDKVEAVIIPRHEREAQKNVTAFADGIVVVIVFIVSALYSLGIIGP